MAQPEQTLAPLEQRIEQAVRDLESRTLAALPDQLARLVYLASTRDYNTGEYLHAGLASRFQADAAAAALSETHERVFRDVLLLSLRDLTGEVERYLDASEDPSRTMDSWIALKAYQILIPARCDAISSGLFCSNIRLALAVLTLRRNRTGPDARKTT
jgi:hypothetical protein